MAHKEWASKALFPELVLYYSLFFNYIAKWQLVVSAKQPFEGKGYSMRRMATELTKRKVKTPRGGTWHAQTVKMVMQRLAAW